MILSRLKRNDKIGLFFFVAFVTSMSLLWFFEERYDKAAWLSTPSERYKMVDDIIESQLLMRKSKAEVIELLGQPDTTLSQPEDGFIYRLGTPPSFFDDKPEQLLIIFELGSVSKVTLALE